MKFIQISLHFGLIPPESIAEKSKNEILKKTTAMKPHVASVANGARGNLMLPNYLTF